VILEDDEANF
jgi:hypothetical protein